LSGAAHPPRTAAARGRSRLRPSAARLGLAALGAALGLEFGLVLCGVHGGTFLGRPLPPFGPLTNESQATALARGLYDDAEGHGIGAWDRDLGWTLLAHGRSEDGTQTVNSSRSRGPREYLPERAPGGLRLLCFGDSFTFGDEVPDAAAYPAQLEALGAERGLAVEALNFGLPGGGTDQALLHFRRERGRWSPDVVAIGLLLENIGRNVNRYRPRWSPHTGTPSAKPRFLLDAQGELVLLPPPPFESRNAYFRGVRDGVVWRETAEHDYWDGRPDLGPLRFVATARVIGLVLAHRERQPRRLWQEPEGEPFRVTVALLETFHREALAAGARAAPVLIFPEA
jgi:hypothetical protein